MSTLSEENPLEGTPYLLGDEHGDKERFAKLIHKAENTRELADRARKKVEHETAEILDQYAVSLRADLVAESNQIEGYDWTQGQVEEAVRDNMGQLAGPVRDFIELIKSDPKLYEALGLYRAYSIAHEWSTLKSRPNQADIRQLHRVIIGDLHHAGRYKDKPNAIGGSSHEPPAPYDVPMAMTQMCDWWATGSSNAVLDAAVIHAWITHIHPFEDGNGRMARILANIALVNEGYPPFLIRSADDRIEYYAALQESDDGNIQPLFKLFTRVMQRTARTMLANDYVERQLEQNYLSDDDGRYNRWSELVAKFFDRLEDELSEHSIDSSFRSVPSIESFKLLRKRSSAGNTWASVLSAPDGREALLWFGFPTLPVADWLGESEKSDFYPSLFLSFHSEDTHADHPFEPRMDVDDGIFNELHMRPLEKLPITMRHGRKISGRSFHTGTRKVVADIRNHFR